VALKSITKVPNQKVTRQQKCFSFFFFIFFFFFLFFFFSSSSSSDGLVQICVTLSRWFLHKTAAFSLSRAPTHRFFPGLKSHEAI